MSDVISRQAAKDMIKNHKSDFSTEKDYRTARACVNAVPPAQLGANLAEVGTDCISRQAAIDAVNCVMVMKGIRSWKSIVSETVESAKRIMTDNIRDLPPAQPEIIRCKDCKHFKQVFAPNDNDGLCGHWHSKCDARTSQNGYCSHAERREEME